MKLVAAVGSLSCTFNEEDTTRNLKLALTQKREAKNLGNATN
jgi:hypothetical protein